MIFSKGTPLTAFSAIAYLVASSETSAQTVVSVTQFSYDSEGRVECTATRMNPTTFGSTPLSACNQGVQGNFGPDRISKNEYDASGQLVQVRRAVGTSQEQAYVTYSYSVNGLPEYMIDANGNRTKFVYDGFGRRVAWYLPSYLLAPNFTGSSAASALATAGSVNQNDYEAYGLDANGNRTSLRKRDGRTFSYTYDALNRMTSKVVPDSCVAGYACTNVPASMTRDVYYSYDLQGLQTAARFDSSTGSDTVGSAYDGLGRLVTSTTSMGGVTRSLTYQYDANGNRTRVTYPDGNFAGYHYDGLDRLDTVGVSATSGLLMRYYDAAGRLAQNGSGSWTYYAYDGVDRLIGQNEALAGGTGNVNVTFGYNPASQIVTRTRSNDVYAFSGYANINRSYAVNGLNQYTAVAGNSYGYDSNGNLTFDGGISYTYDAENRLVVTSAGAQLTYDPLGRLYETYKPTTGTTRFLYDGDQLAAEYDAAGTMLKRYIHGTGEDDPLAWFDGAAWGGSWSNAHLAKPDHQGSLVLWTDWNGALSQINSYDEYGVPAATNAGRFQYTGQAWIPELGMYYYKARIYSPMLGRFLQTDPIGYQDQINLYAYAGNDPLNLVDPAGTHGRDATWQNRDNEWKQYDRAQKAAASRLEKATAWVDGALSKGGDDLKEVSSRFEEVFGKGSATRENMEAVSSTMKKMSAALRDDGSKGFWASAETAKQFEDTGHKGALAYNPINSKLMHINIENENFGNEEVLTWAVGHESGHGAGLVHPRVNGVTPYVLTTNRQAVQTYKALPTAARLRNPDKFMSFAIGYIPQVR